jgi:hypothetical protein
MTGACHTFVSTTARLAAFLQQFANFVGLHGLFVEDRRCNYSVI